LTDVHLLPVFDIATIPEVGCTTPSVPQSAPDSEIQQAAVMAVAASDCFNWGYDPFHFNAPEGSYSTHADDGRTRILELRSMVLALHRIGLRVGMDVVYNHMSASGQADKSVLDRIVPGYYHRLDAQGNVEHSTCCDNTATEHRMMGKLMVDSVEGWIRDYQIDSFRFDLMGHQPRAVMEQLQQRADAAAGRHVNLIGEGWNFGEIANGVRFVQASQLSLNGSGIGTFSDRGRDAVRGGRAGEGGRDLVRNQGYVNGLVYDPNALADAQPEELLKSADMVRVGLAGSIRDFQMTDHRGQTKPLSAYDYGGQSAGYVSEPGEVVNYVENHDNQTLFDINAYKLPLATSAEDRARVQMLAATINAFSQGVAYFHAGVETLRSKSLDGNSFDSGDWFNRLDWTFSDNYFGIGAPPKADNGANYDWIKPLLANPTVRPAPSNIRWARDQFTDLLRLRGSSSLFRLANAKDIRERLTFYNTGPSQKPTVLVGHLRGEGYPGAVFRELMYLVNVDIVPQQVVVSEQKGKRYALHPIHLGVQAADKRPLQAARYDGRTGTFEVPARTAVVYVIQ
jgi:pullulanase-type alpha-1,6-glucosidase